MRKKKFKVGDLVVPLKPKKSWRKVWPSYIREMDQYVGTVGEIVGCSRGIIVNFPPGSTSMIGSWEYRSGWVREATETEARVYKFIKNVKGEYDKESY